MVIDSNFYMTLAISEAWKYQGFTYPNPAVGACVVGEHGEILSVNAHQKAGMPHAEVMALKDAYSNLTQDSNILKLSNSSDIHNYLIKNHNNIFKNSTIYSTLEPCSHIGKTPSCASLISSLNLKSVYIGCNDFNKVASNGREILKKSNILVYEDILSKENQNLLLPFKLWKEDKFILFKWAQRLDGSTNDGIISSNASRLEVHKIRDVIDLLVIGGNSVRVDRPTLDARLVNGKAPDVLILSQRKDFDKTIPLFNVPNRKVFIEDNLDRLKDYKNIMIEGSAKMYELTKDIVDIYLCYVAPKFAKSDGMKGLDDEFEILHHRKLENDLVIWMKRK